MTTRFHTTVETISGIAPVQMQLPIEVFCTACKKPMTVTKLNKYGLCTTCVTHGDTYKNGKWYGESDGKPPFSFEFEVVYAADDEEDDDDHGDYIDDCSCPDCRRERAKSKRKPVTTFSDLEEAGFLKTYDCTVDYEYKSPIYRETKPFVSILPVLDQFKKNIDRRCGTHTHVQVENQPNFLGQVGDMLLPLQRHLIANTAETIKVWGRYFGSYCQYGSTDRAGGSWFNASDPQHPTFEWRLIQFRDSAQFKDIVYWVRDTTQYMDYELGRWGKRSHEARQLIGEHVLESYQKAVC